MRKILKRTLSIALVICMMLSVIPMANADEPEAPVTYNYLFTSNSTLTSIARPEQNPDNEPWWAYHGTSLSSTAVSNKNLSMNTTNSAHWVALTVYLPTDGQYDLTIGFYGSGSRVQVGLISATDYDVSSLAGSKVPTASHPMFNNAAVKGVYNGRFAARVGQDYGVGYLGNVELAAGEYVLLIQPLDGDAANTSNYIYFRDLTLTKNDVAGKDFLTAINKEFTVAWDSRQDSGTCGQLCADLTTTADVSLKSVARLDMQGFDLTANSVSTAAGSHLFDSTDGQSVLTTLAGAPVLQPSNGAWTTLSTMSGSPVYTVKDENQLTLRTGVNTFKFVVPTVALADALQTPVNAKSESAIVFDVKMPTEADYGFVDEDIEISLTLQFGENEPVTYYYSNNGDAENANQVAAWADNAGAGDKLFYADLVNLDAIAGETLVVTAQISWNNVVVFDTAEYQIAA